MNLWLHSKKIYHYFYLLEVCRLSIIKSLIQFHIFLENLISTPLKDKMFNYLNEFKNLQDIRNNYENNMNSNLLVLL